ncbi:MAG: pitrilysin family protein, partial [Thermoanaerobaculia bacterium]|nr:pitrilysin family protein [Thermoanaerobaculia bacterium]
MSEQMSWRERPPSPAEPREWSFPDIERRVLSNGLRVLCARHGSAPLVSVRAVVRSGASSEPEDRAGLASLTASLLDEGAGERDALTIAEDVARLGAFLGTGADWDASYVSLDVLSRNLEPGLEIVRDVLAEPHFEQEEIDRERDRRLTTILQQRDEPSFIASRSFTGMVYEGVRWGSPLIGTEQTLQSITREDVVDHYDETFAPSNVCVSALSRKALRLHSTAKSANPPERSFSMGRLRPTWLP